MDGASTLTQAACDVSVVVPAFNEAANIRELVERTCAAVEPLGSFEVILVDDGSTRRDVGRRSNGPPAITRRSSASVCSATSVSTRRSRPASPRHGATWSSRSTRTCRTRPKRSRSSSHASGPTATLRAAGGRLRKDSFARHLPVAADEPDHRSRDRRDAARLRLHAARLRPRRRRPGAGVSRDEQGDHRPGVAGWACASSRCRWSTTPASPAARATTSGASSR